MANINVDDVKALSEILDTVTDKLPLLINGIVTTLYSAEAGKGMGQAIGSFYKELLEAGIPEDAALEMAKSYMISMKDLSNIVDK